MKIVFIFCNALHEAQFYSMEDLLVQLGNAPKHHSDSLVLNLVVKVQKVIIECSEPYWLGLTTLSEPK